LTRWLADGARATVPWQRLRLQHGPVTLRPIERRDQAPLVTFPMMVRDLRRQAKEGRCLPFALLVDGEFAGQVTVSNIVGGSARFASVGYWIDQRHAGRGHVPVAVALAVDHCFFTVGLHRIEIAIRPENAASLRVVEKLALAEIGYAPRFLHIDGEWRDHRIFAVTVEEAPEGLLNRLFQG
jgi:ribosomal-protein-alanine N-acetyltransferase